MMQLAGQVIGPFLAAALGWVVLEFVGRPLRKFNDLMRTPCCVALKRAYADR